MRRRIVEELRSNPLLVRHWKRDKGGNYSKTKK